MYLNISLLMGIKAFLKIVLTLMKLTLKEKLVIQTIFTESYHYLLV